MLKVFGGYKDEKNSISALPTPIWSKFGFEMSEVYVYYILQGSSKSVEQSVNFEKCTFEKITQFLTKFDPISGPPIAFLGATTKISNRGTLQVCRKITKITHPNSVFFLGDVANPRMRR